MALRCFQLPIKLLLTCSWPGFNLLHICLLPRTYVLSFELGEAAECFIHQLRRMLASPVRWRCCISITPPTIRSLGSMTSVAALFYDPLGVQERSFPHPVLTHCLLSKTPVFWWETKTGEKTNTLAADGATELRFQGNLMLRAGCFTCVHSKPRGAGVDCGCKDGKGVRGGRILGKVFFAFRQENRPWFPGTMQLMRASPRKIKLWHHGFLKYTAEPTLSYYNQVSVNFHCRLKPRKRENLQIPKLSCFFF